MRAFLLGLGVVLVVFLLLGQVFLNLPDVGAYIGRGREDGGYGEGTKGSACCRPLGFGLEYVVVLDGVVDGAGGEEGVGLVPARGGLVLGEDGIDDGLLGERPVRFDLLLSGL